MSKISEKIYIPVLFFLLVQMFISNELFWALGMVCALYFLFHDRFRLVLPFKEYRMLFVFMVWGIFLGLFIIGRLDTSLRDYLRDIFYYSTPIIYIYLGACYARKQIKTSRILNSFIVSSAMISVIYLIRIIQQGAVFLANSDIHGWRLISGGGTIVIGVSLAIHLSDIIEPEDRLPRFWSITCFLISGLFFVLSLSRTNLLIVMIMSFVLFLKRKNSKKTAKRFLLIIVAVFAFVILTVVLLPEGFVKGYSTKILNSFTEIKTTNEWNDVTIQSNWRGYENYCALEQWKDASLFVQIMGSGFGRRIYVGDYAFRYLSQRYSDGSPASSIAVLHNGYATHLIKLGLLGVIMYVVFYLCMIKKAWALSSRTKTMEARLLLAVSLTLVFQTYFLNGLFRDYCYYPFILLLGYAGYKAVRMQDECSILQ